jgi:hypothetical protein
MTSPAAEVKQPSPPGKKVLFPRYILKEADGVYVNLAIFPVAGGFDKFIERLFGDGFRFVRTDYQLLTSLLYYHDSVLDTVGRDAKVKLADDIVGFPAKRKALYRGVRLEEDFLHAEYIFEPVEIVLETEKPVYGEAGADGIRPVVGTERISEVCPTSLDLDEFIAEMWLKGIRFGIDVEQVAGAIATRRMARMFFANQQDAIPGGDAEIVEASDVLRPDNAPKQLANGKADLSKFQNLFPHIEKGALLLRKKMGVPGKAGCKVNGERIVSEPPKDLDLQALAGEGTCIELIDGEECIVAAKSGFLALDVNTNIIEVTDKIENKAGISAKTTGDLSLSGKDYIEHGVVQEGRTVEGTNMTFLADVHGTVVSKNGLVLLEKDLSSGCVESYNGEVTSNGRVLNSIIEVHDRRGEKAVGTITLNYAEACFISGHTVIIKHAVNCEIVAENVEIGIVEGCSVVAKAVKINSSNVCRRREANIALILPDFSEFVTQVAQAKKSIEKCEKIIQEKDKEVAKLRSDPDIARYLTMAAGIKRSPVKLTEAQQVAWGKMTSNFKFAKAESALARLTADKLDQQKLAQTSRQEIAILIEKREQAGLSIYCKISEVVGNTLVRIMPDVHEITELQKLKSSELKLKLRENGQDRDRVFFNEEGSLDWEYKAPVIEIEPGIANVAVLSAPVVNGSQVALAVAEANSSQVMPPVRNENTSGVSINAKDFTEPDVVLEGRIVEGVNMTFRSDVYGTVVSKSGQVLLESNLLNASIQSFNGDVTIKGRSINSIIEVNDRRGEKAVGNITLNYAEACLISGHTVVIKHAMNCEIVAEHVEIGTVEGCSVVAKSVKINSSNVCRRREANIAMVLPDLSEFEVKIAQLKRSIDKCSNIIELKDREVAQISALPDVANYLALAESIKKSGVSLTKAQQENWDKMATKFKFAKADTSLARLSADKQDQLKLVETYQQEISVLMGLREQAAQGVRCNIAKVVGNTLVRIMPDAHDISLFQKLKSSEIKLKLRENGVEAERIYFNDEGSLDWEYKTPEIVPELPI